MDKMSAMILFLVSSSVLANANLAKPLSSLTQVYYDGSSSTLSCVQAKKPGDFPVCHFEYKEDGRKRIFKLPVNIMDYSVAFEIPTWRYKIFGSIEHFFIEFEVPCVEADYSIVGKNKIPTCSIQFKPERGVMRARGVTIYYFDDREVVRYRKIKYIHRNPL